MRDVFTLGQKQIEQVDHFNYLGVTLTYNGIFNKAIKDMTTKAMKASFKICKTLKSKQVLNSELYTRLFDSIVKPVALYGSQVWSEQLVKFFQKDDFGNLDTLSFE